MPKQVVIVRYERASGLPEWELRPAKFYWTGSRWDASHQEAQTYDPDTNECAEAESEARAMNPEPIWGDDVTIFTEER